MSNHCMNATCLKVAARTLYRALMIILCVGTLVFGSLKDPPLAKAYHFEPESNLLHVKEFFNKALPFWVGDNIPQFRNPHEINNNELLNLLVMSDFTPRTQDQDRHWQKYISAEDVEKTAKIIFGPDIKQVHHECVNLYMYDSDSRLYSTRPVGGGIPHTELHIIDIHETETEYIVDAVHAFHSFNIYDMFDDPDLGIDIYDDLGNYVVTLDDFDDDYSAYLPSMPVRRYILKKSGTGDYYFSQSMMREASTPGDTQPIINLKTGDRVVDPSWVWEHRFGEYYSNTNRFGDPAPPGEIKPVTWIVVAKDHYGAGSGITLLAEEVIARFPFDNSTGRIPGQTYHSGFNHWGESGTGNATHGLRPWLNSSGIHSGEGFYQAFSGAFQAAVVTVSVPNRHWKTGATYLTSDRVFIPSTTELGDTEHLETYRIGKAYPYFFGSSDADRIAGRSSVSAWYWARSPGLDRVGSISKINGHGDGNIGTFHANDSRSGPRPTLNLKSDTLVSAVPNADGTYVINFDAPQLPEKKAIYVLPGYMGSHLYASTNNMPVWGSFSAIPFTHIELTVKPSYLNSDASGINNKVKVDEERDKYGTFNTYEDLVEDLKDHFKDTHDIHFFPYNWLGDLRESVISLEENIDKNEYEDVVFVTHSTGGLLAAAYIAKSNINKDKVEQAILIAAPLFGTYSALEPIETGRNSTIDLYLGLATALKPGFIFRIPLAHYNVRKITGNSPTTYQLLPSAEYLNQIPFRLLLNNGQMKETRTMSAYYSVLNQSSHINPYLTTGNNNRSHRHFRDEVFGKSPVGKSIVEILQQVNTTLICTRYGHKTPNTAIYSQGSDGTIRLEKIHYDLVGDGTVSLYSAAALEKAGSGKLKVYHHFRDQHTDLIKSDDVIACIITTIKGKECTPASIMLQQEPPSDGMTTSVTLDFKADALVDVEIIDSDANVVASLAEGEIIGFDDDFLFIPYLFEEDEINATIYLPHGGYQVNFSYGSSANVAVDFSVDAATLDYNGYMTSSATYTATETGVNGLLLSLDMLNLTVEKENVGSLAEGSPVSVQIYYELWQIEEERLLPNVGATDTTALFGDDVTAGNVAAADLAWSSSDPAIVTVSDIGVIEAIDHGVAMIYASATDGSYRLLSCRVTVPLTATSITIDNVTMVIDERVLIRPAFAPKNTTEKEIAYEYDQASGVIEIDEFGVIKGLSPGIVEITGTAPGGAESIFNVTVEGASGAKLSALTTNPGMLTPPFSENVTEYTADVSYDTSLIEVTATLSNPAAAVTIDGEAATSGEIKTVTLGAAGTETAINVLVTAEDDSTTKTYTITVSRAEKESPSEPGAYSVGFYDPVDGNFHLQNAGHVRFGPRNSSWQPLTGDWNGDGNYTVGLYDPAEGNFWLRSVTDEVDHIRFGDRNSKRIAITGDWNGDGNYGVGLYDQAEGKLYLNCEEVISGGFGAPGNDWIPVAGDWNGNGDYTVALYDSYDGNFHPYGQSAIRFGPKYLNWTPVTGDWNGDGTYGVGLHYDGHFHLDQSAGLEKPHRFGPRGDTDWIPVTGLW